jgi:two-component system response regulator YesN
MGEILKVFLCEDEYIIRQALKKTIHWEREGFELVGEAGDGETAYPLITELSPDILITDIRMPFMDGLELSRLVREAFPNIKIVILSGYDDFAYAREAISIGVTDYLLKPITEEKLMESLGNVREKVIEEREHDHLKALFEKEQEEKRALEQQGVLRDMMNGRLSMTDVLEKGRALNISLMSPWYGILLFQYRSADETMDQSAYDEVNISIHDRIAKEMEPLPYIRVCEQVGNIQNFLVMGQSRLQVEERMRNAIERFDDILKEHPHHIFFAADSVPVSRVSELGECYQRVSRVFARRFLSSGSRIFHESTATEAENGVTEGAESGKKSANGKTSESADIFEGIVESELTPDRRPGNRKTTGTDTDRHNADVIDIGTLDIGKLDHRVMLSFFGTGSPEDIGTFTDSYLDSIGKANLMSTMLRQYIILDVCFCATSFLESIGMPGGEIQKRFDQFRKTITTNSIEEAKRLLQSIFETVIGERLQRAEQKYTHIIEEAKQYIQENFFREDISLKATAAQVGFSPNHFSGIFSQETGKTFIEYLTNVRIDRAKALLRSTPMKTSEISFEIGYRDPHYFSYIFRKIEGVTPREYRNSGK